MPTKKKRQTFEKLRREQAVRERRVRKQERKEAAREAKAANLSSDSSAAPEVAGFATNAAESEALAASGGGRPKEAVRDES
jgi:hypothetical protein